MNQFQIPDEAISNLLFAYIIKQDILLDLWINNMPDWLI